MKKIKSIMLVILFVPVSLAAQVNLPEIITDNMVLQQGKKVPVWGTAVPGAEVTVMFMHQKKRAVADTAGRWRVCLDAMSADNNPYRLTVRSGRARIVLENVVVGEVWLASGQSNMEYSMNNHPQHPKPAKGDRDYLHKAFTAADSPLIRVLHVKKQLADTLPTDGWKTLDSASLAPVSAVGYFFAEYVSEALGVPVGIISSAWGGTPIEHWISRDAFENSPVFGEDVLSGRYDGMEIARRYDKMIAPMAPFAMRGILWYQGEQNVILGDTDIYAEKQKLLIQDWRDKWEDQSLSFYYVQLAPHDYSARRNDVKAKTWEALPMFWQAQQACLAMPGTGMAVITDLIDKPSQIHPSYKWEVGRRLALIALARDYGKDVMYSGPVFKSVAFENGEAIVSFDNVGDGLVTDDGKAPDWFWLSDDSGRYFKGEARIIAPDRVAVKCKRYRKPSSVRFAWDEIASPNLFNSEGLPAVPFGSKTK